MYGMIFKRKSFHIFRNVGEEKLSEEDLQGIRNAYESIEPLYSEIKTEIRIVPANEKFLGRGAEYAIEIYSEKKGNYLMNAGFIGEMLDLYLVSKDIGSLWFGIGKPEECEYNGLPFVIMILIRKIDSSEKFRKDMFRCKRKAIGEIWQGDPIPGVSDIARFAPSACNSQPWRVKRNGAALELYRYRKPGRSGLMPANMARTLNRIDMGIFICFLELCLKHEKIDFSRELFMDEGAEAEWSLNAMYSLEADSSGDREPSRGSLKQLTSFYQIADENGVTNLEKIRMNQKILRRVETTDKSRSVEAVDSVSADHVIPDGIVTENGRIVGFGIHIFNEDVYPLKSFEIYLRSCGLTGELNLSDCTDMVFVDVYHNHITAVKSRNMPSLRIFGVQDNLLEVLDVSEMPRCQGIDAGMNRLKELDVSKNPELVELYVNDNSLTEADLSHNPKLKYFYCHNNRITGLDTTNNPLLRHLNATGNPMKSIRSLAPQRDAALPLEVYAGDGGCIGLKFNPVYSAQWKETGEWQQTYYASPDEGYRFEGWYENGIRVSGSETWTDVYGTSRVITARFIRAR